MGTYFVNRFVCGAVLICFFSVSVSVVQSTTTKDPDYIQMRIKTFLKSHCNSKNYTVHQNELDNFAMCNPTQTASAFTNIETFKSLEPELRHSAIKKEIVMQCAVFKEKRDCQKNTFKLIEKCFDGQQEFVFYFMMALSETICQDNGEIFIRFWERGGEACLKEHLSHLTKEIAQCFTFTATVTKQELDRNLYAITQCIGRQFSSCTNAYTREMVQMLVNDIETFYHETRGTTAGSSTNSPLAIISLPFLLNIIIHRIILS